MRHAEIYAWSLWASLVLLWGILIMGCVPPEESEPLHINYTLEDPVCRTILDFQDKQLVDSIFPYLRHNNPTYRWLGARAFASIRMEKAIDSLIPLLNDSWTEIRTEAAFALGQIGSQQAEPALIDAFEQGDSLGQYTKSNAAILEAVGKCGGEESLHQLVKISTYLPTDTILLTGQARGIYRFMLRGLTDSLGSRKMIEWLAQTSYPNSVRLIAADYLRRTEQSEFGDQLQGLRNAYQTDRDEDIRSALAAVLGRTGQKSILKLFEQRWDRSLPVNERCNIMASCTSFAYRDVMDFAKKALSDPNPLVGQQAARFFLERGSEDDASEYREWAQDEQLDASVRLILLRAALRHLPFYYALTKASIRGSLKSTFNNNSDPYVRSEALLALSEEWDYRTDIVEAMSMKELPPVRTGAVRAYNNAFEQADKLSDREKTEWMLELQDVLLSDDPGMTYEAAIAIQKYSEDLPLDRLDLDRIKARQDDCSLPRNIETYNALGSLISSMGSDEFERRSPDFTHPIDWSSVRNCTDSTFARISTNKGPVEIRLFKSIAPGTVANFVQLVRSDFYDGMRVHRVVPDFVIQDGCPRGDGFGSQDYAIRSETPPIYYDRAGRLGMASAGPHTESTQWFVTHRPTPHLDGRYTIFGQVISGMDIIHAIQVGDSIQSIELSNLKKTKKSQKR